MSAHWLSRAELIYGEDALERLAGARIALFGIGGVGGHAMEALVRSGVGALDLIDADVVDETNLNRQLIATRDVLGMKKTEAAAKRALSVNPDIKLTLHDVFFLPESAHLFDFSKYDYILDCIDTVSGKIALAEQAYAAGVPIISAMGCGGKTDPSRLRVADINKTSVCPLAKAVRIELRKRGIPKLKVVYSDESAVVREKRAAAEGGARHVRVIGSGAFVPCACGILMASEVVKDLCAL